MAEQVVPCEELPWVRVFEVVGLEKVHGKYDAEGTESEETEGNSSLAKSTEAGQLYISAERVGKKRNGKRDWGTGFTITTLGLLSQAG